MLLATLALRTLHGIDLSFEGHDLRPQLFSVVLWSEHGAHAGRALRVRQARVLGGVRGVAAGAARPVR